MSVLKIIGYARESTKDQAVNGFNMDDQEKKIRAYVDLFFSGKDYTLEIIREEGASAKSLERPRIQEILQRIRKKQLDVLVIHNLDRLTRKVRDLAALLEDFEKYHIKLISITEKIDTETPMGRFFIYLIVLVAQWEWETIRTRTIRGLEESARQGNFAKGNVSFGYVKDPKNKHKLLINESEAITVRRIFDEIGMKSETLTTVTQKLNQETANGIKWNKNKVKSILDNQLYYGMFILMGREYPDHVPAIITKEQFEAAQRRITPSKTRSKYKYVYKRMIICTKCNMVMATTSIKKDELVHIYYRCSKCRAYVNEKRINEQFSESFTKILKRDKYFLDIEKYKKTFEEISEYIEKIPEEQILSGFEYGLKEMLMERSIEEKKDLEWCMRVMQLDISYISFEILPFREKRAFLSSHVKQIYFDPRSKGLEIEYMNGGDIDKKSFKCHCGNCLGNVE